MINQENENKTPLFLLRKKIGLSRNEAAVLLKIGLTTLARYENADNDVPCGVAEDMAIIYGVPFDVVRKAIKETKNFSSSKDTKLTKKGFSIEIRR